MLPSTQYYIMMGCCLVCLVLIALINAIAHIISTYINRKGK